MEDRRVNVSLFAGVLLLGAICGFSTIYVFERRFQNLETKFQTLDAVQNQYFNVLDKVLDTLSRNTTGTEITNRRYKRQTKTNGEEGSIYRELVSISDRLRLLLSIQSQKQMFTGLQGPAGPPGRDGYNGLRGLRGATGPPGLPGKNGNQGANGVAGMSGIPGIPGFNGDKGIKGEAGMMGKPGLRGTPGVIGREGPQGYPGHHGVKGEPGVCMCPKTTSRPVEVAGRKFGMMYTVWGSVKCPVESSLLYSGQIAMSQYKPRGESDIETGSNALCLPVSSLSHKKRAENGGDVLNKTLDVNATNYNETFWDDFSSQFTPQPPDDVFKKYAKLIGTRKYVSCAKCYREERSSHLMLPSKSTCPTGWDIEYRGYLMNYHQSTVQSQVICVKDQALGLSPNSEVGLLHIISNYMSPIKVECSSLPCDLISDKQLKCIVCSK